MGPVDSLRPLDVSEGIFKLPWNKAAEPTRTAQLNKHSCTIGGMVSMIKPLYCDSVAYHRSIF